MYTEVQIGSLGRRNTPLSRQTLWAESVTSFDLTELTCLAIHFQVQVNGMSLLRIQA